MTFLSFFATSLIFVGGMIAAITHFRSQHNLLDYNRLSHGQLEESRALARHVARENPRFLAGLQPSQLRVFWSAIALVMLGNLVLVLITGSNWLAGASGSLLLPGCEPSGECLAPITLPV